MTVETKKTSHKEILKATGILGGAQVIEILIRIARNKIVALLLGPVGVGVIGLYQSIIDLIRSATGFGLEFSAVRDIAQAVGSDDETQISRSILILRRWVWFTGLMGMLLTLLFSKPLSRYAFGDEKYAWSIAVLSVVLLLSALSGGQLALLQGLRKIGLMARAKVWGLVVGFCISVPLFWLLGIDAIVPVFFLSAVFILFFTWFYSRKIHIQKVEINMKDTFYDGLGMVRLGFFMVITSFITVAVMYIVRAFISNKSGLEGVGLFQAAWNLSSLYLSAVLQSMGADYFPRLSAVNENNAQVVKLANEQTEIALLVAGPLVVGMLSFINLVVMILYSTEFAAATSILHWMLAGTFLKIISWPIAFIILAKGRGAIFICTEVTSNTFLISLTYLFWDSFGLEATGIAFFLMYFFYTGIVAVVVKALCGFSWSSQNIKLIAVFGIFILFAFLTSKFLSGSISYFFGASITFAAIVFSWYELHKLVDLKALRDKFYSKLTS